MFAVVSVFFSSCLPPPTTSIRQKLIHQLVTFVEGIGLNVRREVLPGPTFLPGITIDQGELIIDTALLLWPGDIFHEAGHLATASPSRRSVIGGTLAVTPAEEMAAIAWSYAAAVSAGVDPSIIFHEGGYKSDGPELIAQYASGNAPGGPGVPLLRDFGMTSTFPQMDHWLRQAVRLSS
jgi:hypothetical protein